jgi:transcriptional regulator with XRE-family HTH domain
MNLVRLRREKGWSQEDLALEAGLHRTFVAHVERQVRNISIDNIERLGKRPASQHPQPAVAVVPAAITFTIHLTHVSALGERAALPSANQINAI